MRDNLENLCFKTKQCNKGAMEKAHNLYQDKEEDWSLITEA
jgi:hypothetical protein